MLIRKARPDEFPRVLSFYYDLIDGMAGMPYHPKWKKGVYPEEEALKASVERGELFVAEDDGVFIGAMILNHRTTEGYEKAPWKVEAAPDEVTVIHTLGAAVSRMRSGVGKALVREAVRLSREAGQKAIRLDVIDGNLPAEKLYTGQGFRFVSRQTLFYEDTGLCAFDLYELPLTEEE